MGKTLQGRRRPEIRTVFNICDSYRGDSYGNIGAYGPDGGLVGVLQFAGNDERVQIQWMEVQASWRRKGVGTALVAKLEEEFDGAEIDWGMTTDEGEMLRKKVNARRLACPLKWRLKRPESWE